MKKYILLILPFLLFASIAFAEQRWIYITLEQTPIKDRNGNTVKRPVFFSKDKHRLTTGGEFVIPEDIKKHRAIERIQKDKQLLVKVDVPKDKKMPGDMIKEDQVPLIKKITFGIPEKKVDSGVTK